MNQGMGVAIRSSWQLNEPVLGDTFSFVHAFAFAPPLPEFLAGVGAFGCFRWSFAYSAFASSRNWPLWLFRGYATQVLECGRWVSIHCRDCEVLKCEAAESTGFDTETAIKSTGLGLTSMQERLRLVHGELSINSKPKGGTAIHARVPCDSSSHSAWAAG
jgi:hypothetical protein